MRITWRVSRRRHGKRRVDDVAPQHDPFHKPDDEDEADTQERALAGGEEAGDGDLPEVRRELGIEDAADDTGWTSGPAPSMSSGHSPADEEAISSRTENARAGFEEHDWEARGRRSRKPRRTIRTRR
jgi:hypothetical protein